MHRGIWGPCPSIFGCEAVLLNSIHDSDVPLWKLRHRWLRRQKTARSIKWARWGGQYFRADSSDKLQHLWVWGGRRGSQQSYVVLAFPYGQFFLFQKSDSIKVQTLLWPEWRPPSLKFSYGKRRTFREYSLRIRPNEQYFHDGPDRWSSCLHRTSKRFI